MVSENTTTTCYRQRSAEYFISCSWPWGTIFNLSPVPCACSVYSQVNTDAWTIWTKDIRGFAHLAVNSWQICLLRFCHLSVQLCRICLMHLGKLLDWWNLGLFLSYLYDDDEALPMPVSDSNNVLVHVSIVTFYYDIMSCHLLKFSPVSPHLTYLVFTWTMI